MLQLDDVIAALPRRPDAEALLRQFVPPPRFAEKSFADYHPQDPSQGAARDRLAALAAELDAAGRNLLGRLRARMGSAPRGGGVYLDGGFGVGKTHLLAAFWNAAPAPKAYLSFDELVYFTPYARDSAVRERFLRQRVICVDEWELDDPGNLTLALSVLREILAEGAQVVTTSNTIPLELGAGRFSQKDFQLEIGELASAFEVVSLRGDDYRHRHFEAVLGAEYFLDRDALRERARASGARALRVEFTVLLQALGEIHPLRYVDLIRAVSGVYVEGMDRITHLTDALRFVHFVDRLYNSAVPLAASSALGLAELFPPAFLAGPYGKKCSRCLSRLEEMLAER